MLVPRNLNLSLVYQKRLAGNSGYSEQPSIDCKQRGMMIKTSVTIQGLLGTCRHVYRVPIITSCRAPITKGHSVRGKNLWHEVLANYFRRPGLSLFIITVAALTFFSSRLNAETQEQAEDKPSHEVDSYVRYIPSRSVDAMSGKVEIIESGAEYSYEFKAFDKLPLKLSLDNNYISIENSLDSVELPAHLVGLTTDIETTVPFFHFNKTYLRLGISPSFYADDWDFPSSSFRIPSRYFLIYQPDAKWTFLYGVAVYPDFKHEVLPILGFIYKPNDKLAFNIVPKRPNITYFINDRMSLFAEGGTSLNSEFEVTRDNTKNVVLRYKEARLGGGIKFKFNQYIQSSISAGGIFNRSLKYRDGQGKVNIKDGLYTEFRIEIKP